MSTSKDGKLAYAVDPVGEYDLQFAGGGWLFHCTSTINPTPKERADDEETLSHLALCWNSHDALVEALRPFAKFACSPLNSCGGCHNCKAAAALSSIDQEKAK